jgi:predicted amidohydrolase YtcJ
MNQLKIFDNLTLFKIWCETKPQTIFPNRKIGYLEPGYEASFLVLDENPVEDFLNIKRIYLRVKQGQDNSP